MVKILSRTGFSLADIYDVVGSIAGIEQLETRELGVVHEMGATVMSERFTTRVFRVSTGALAQNITFNVEEVNLPTEATRLLGVQVITSFASRLVQCAVLATDPTLGQDFPIWMLDTSTIVAQNVNMEDAGGAGSQGVLVPRPGLQMFPSFAGGSHQQDSMVSSITLAGVTTGFGAGTVTTTALLLLAFARADGSRPGTTGIPIPSW